jgi:uncharacterized protein (UPF0261 family)
VAAASADQEGELPVTGQAAYLVGAWNEQPRELRHAKSCLERSGLRVVTVELAGGLSPAQVTPRELLRHHPNAGLFARFAGGAVAQEDMAMALARFLGSRRDLGALLVVTRESNAPAALASAQAVPMHVPRLVVGEQPLRATPGVLAMTMPAGGGAGCDHQLALAAHALAGMLRASAMRETDTHKRDAPFERAVPTHFP